MSGGPSISKQGLVKGLSQDLSMAPRSWSFPYTRPGATENGIMALLVFRNDLYAFNNSKGIVYKFVGATWQVVYSIPTANMMAPWDLAYGQGVFTIGGVERMYMGHLYTTDGITFNFVAGMNGVGYVNAYEEYNGKLYAITSGSRNLYVSTNGFDFTILFTFPNAGLGACTSLRSLIKYYGWLYIGAYRIGAAPIFRYDSTQPITLLNPNLEVTTVADEIQAFASFQGALLAFNKQTGIYVYGAYNYLTPWTNWMIDLPIQNMFSTTRWRGNLIIPCGHRDGDSVYALSKGGYINGSYSGIRLKAVHAASVTGAVCAQVYRGKLYIGSETPNGTGDYDAHVTEFSEWHLKPSPAEYSVWDDKAVGVAGGRPLAIPTIADKKTLYLLSDKAGSVDVEIDINGDNTFRPLETQLPVYGTTLFKYVAYSEFCWGRPFFKPVSAAVVSAWWHTSGE